MKTYQKILIGLGSLAVLLGLGFSQNAIGAVLNSNQVGTNASSGYVLQTNGATSTWVATSSLGISGGGSSTLIYASSGISATASGTNGYIIGNTGVTSFNGATGTITYSSGGSSTNVYGANGITVVQVGTNATTSLNTSTLPGILNGLGYSTSTGITTGSVATLGSPLIVGGNASATIYGTASSSYIANFDTILYAPTNPTSTLACAGYTAVDMGDCINHLETLFPSSGNGGIIVLPAGNFPFTTQIVITKNNQLVGQGGGSFYSNGITTLNYTQSTGTAYQYNVSNSSRAGIGMSNLSLIGPAGVGNIGSSSLTSTGTSTIALGIYLGGSGGATGFVLSGVQVSGFGKGIQFGSNTFITNFQNDVIQKNGIDIYAPATGATSYENDKITNSLIGDCNYASGSIASNCFYINNAGGDWTLQGNDFDDAQINFASTGAINSYLRLSDNHFEPPNSATGCYPFITSASGQAANNTIFSSGNQYLFNGSIGNCPEEVNNGGNFISSGDTLGVYSAGATQTLTFVNQQDSNDVFSWTGLTTSGLTTASQTAYSYASTTLTNTGYAFGNATATWNFSTSSVSFSGTFLVAGTSTFNGNISTTLAGNSFVATNALGILVTTSTPSGGGSGAVTTSTPVTANYFPFWNSTNGSGLNGTSSLYRPSINDVTVASTSDNGLFSVVNASNTVALQVASTTNNNNALTVAGHIGYATSSVSVTSCGTGSPTVTGSDDVGVILTGSSASSCTLNFAKNWVNNPVCVISDSNTSAVTDVSSVTTSTLVVSMASALSAVNIYYECFGNPQ